MGASTSNVAFRFRPDRPVVPLFVAELGGDADPFMLQPFATLAEKERSRQWQEAQWQDRQAREGQAEVSEQEEQVPEVVRPRNDADLDVQGDEGNEAEEGKIL